ncbi:MAG: G5 domain-containing protein [Lachnospirales bacterium]
MSSRNRYSGSYRFKTNSQKPMIFPMQPSNAGRKSSSPRRRSRGSGFNINLRPFLFLIAVVFIIVGLGYMAFSRQALAVMVNGEAVGYIKDMNTTEEEVNALILAKLKEDVGNNIEINEKITLEKVNSIFKNVSNNAEGVIAQVCKAVTYKQEATKIVIDGKQACIVSNADVAKDVLNTILSNYKPSDGTTNPEFAAQVKTEAAFVESTEVADKDTAVKLLSQTKQEEKIHTVVQGDTFASIAKNAGMTEADLLKANPSITAETKTNLSIGQQIKVIMTVPTIAIRTYKINTKTVDIPYETERKADDSMYEGEEEEVQEGVDGQKEVYEKVAYINGTPQGAATTSEKVIKEPVTRIIKYGTYEPDYDDDDDYDYDDEE